MESIGKGPADLDELAEFYRNLQPGEVTYHQLKTFHIENLKRRLASEGKKEYAANNHATAIKKWWEWLGLSEGDFVGDEMGANFEERLEEHCVALCGQGKANQTISDRKSILKQVYESYLRLLETSNLPRVFSEALALLIRKCGNSARSVARACNLHESTLAHWVTGRHIPYYKNEDQVVSLEHFFKLSPATLLSMLPSFRPGYLKRKHKTRQTPYRAHLAEIVKKKYAFKIGQFSGEQKEEWASLYRFYTDGAWVASVGLNRSRQGWKTQKHTGKNPAAEMKLNMISYFYGYLTLPKDSKDPHLRGLGFDRAVLSLALFSRIDLIYEYLKFKKGRTHGEVYNSATKEFLALCSQLLRPGTGFLWQHPSFACKLTELAPSISTIQADVSAVNGEEAERVKQNKLADLWHSHCAESHRRIRNIINSIRNNENESERFHQTRDTSLEVVKPLIREREHPISVLLEIAERFRKDFKLERNAVRKAMLFRNMVLTEMLASNPVRAANIAHMKYKKGCKGYEEEPTNLYMAPDGALRLKYEAWELKNGNYRGRYDLPINPLFRDDIIEYLGKWRPLLLGAVESDYVFRPSELPDRSVRAGSAEYEDFIRMPMDEAGLSNLILKASQHYIDGCAGFSMHSARHLVATEYLKHHPEGISVAAAILHDSEKMIRETYSWVTPSDISIFWQAHLSPLISEFRDLKKRHLANVANQSERAPSTQLRPM